MSMYNNASNSDHLLDTEYFKKNEHSCSIMYQNMIIYETQEILRENVRI